MVTGTASDLLRLQISIIHPMDQALCDKEDHPTIVEAIEKQFGTDAGGDERALATRRHRSRSA
jgi:hypothetical protein